MFGLKFSYIGLTHLSNIYGVLHMFNVQIYTKHEITRAYCIGLFIGVYLKLFLNVRTLR